MPERAGRRILYSGAVQGVGFRWTARSVAREYDVSGYVKNLPDGTVEVVVEGEPAEMEAFLQSLETAMKGNIRDAKRQDRPASGSFDSFEIRH